MIKRIKWYKGKKDKQEKGIKEDKKAEIRRNMKWEMGEKSSCVVVSSSPGRPQIIK
jgi:hypothetical protein